MTKYTEYKRANKQYKEGELEIILSLAPTNTNIKWLSKLLERSEDAITIIYKIAFKHPPFNPSKMHNNSQVQKINEAKKRINFGKV